MAREWIRTRHLPVDLDEAELWTPKSVNLVQNKTLDSNNTVEIGALDDADTGSLLTWDTARLPALLSPGTAGYVLTSNGTTSVPSWQAGGLGPFTKVGPTNVNSGTADVTILSSVTGRTEIIVMYSGISTSTTAFPLYLKVVDPGGTVVTGYFSITLYLDWVATHSHNVTTTRIAVGNGDVAASTITGLTHLSRIEGFDIWRFYSSAGEAGGDVRISSGYISMSDEITGLVLDGDGNTFDGSGTATVYHR